MHIARLDPVRLCPPESERGLAMMIHRLVRITPIIGLLVTYSAVLALIGAMSACSAYVDGQMDQDRDVGSVTSKLGGSTSCVDVLGSCLANGGGLNLCRQLYLDCKLCSSQGHADIEGKTCTPYEAM